MSIYVKVQLIMYIIIVYVYLIIQIFDDTPTPLFVLGKLVLNMLNARKRLQDQWNCYCTSVYYMTIDM